MSAAARLAAMEREAMRQPASPGAPVGDSPAVPLNMPEVVSAMEARTPGYDITMESGDTRTPPSTAREKQEELLRAGAGFAKEVMAQEQKEEEDSFRAGGEVPSPLQPSPPELGQPPGQSTTELSNVQKLKLMEERTATGYLNTGRAIERAASEKSASIINERIDSGEELPSVPWGIRFAAKLTDDPRLRKQFLQDVYPDHKVINKVEDGLFGETTRTYVVDPKTNEVLALDPELTLKNALSIESLKDITDVFAEVVIAGVSTVSGVAGAMKGAPIGLAAGRPLVGAAAGLTAGGAAGSFAARLSINKMFTELTGVETESLSNTAAKATVDGLFEGLFGPIGAQWALTAFDLGKVTLQKAVGWSAKKLYDGADQELIRTASRFLATQASQDAARLGQPSKFSFTLAQENPTHVNKGIQYYFQNNWVSGKMFLEKNLRNQAFVWGWVDRIIKKKGKGNPTAIFEKAGEVARNTIVQMRDDLGMQARNEFTSLAAEGGGNIVVGSYNYRQALKEIIDKQTQKAGSGSDVIVLSSGGESAGIVKWAETRLKEMEPPPKDVPAVVRQPTISGGQSYRPVIDKVTGEPVMRPGKSREPRGWQIMDFQKQLHDTTKAMASPQGQIKDVTNPGTITRLYRLLHEGLLNDLALAAKQRKNASAGRSAAEAATNSSAAKRLTEVRRIYKDGNNQIRELQDMAIYKSANPSQMLADFMTPSFNQVEVAESMAFLDQFSPQTANEIRAAALMKLMDDSRGPASLAVMETKEAQFKEMTKNIAISFNKLYNMTKRSEDQLRAILNRYRKTKRTKSTLVGELPGEQRKVTEYGVMRRIIPRQGKAHQASYDSMVLVHHVAKRLAQTEAPDHVGMRQVLSIAFNLTMGSVSTTGTKALKLIGKANVDRSLAKLIVDPQSAHWLREVVEWSEKPASKSKKLTPLAGPGKLSQRELRRHLLIQALGGKLAQYILYDHRIGEQD